MKIEKHATEHNELSSGEINFYFILIGQWEDDSLDSKVSIIRKKKTSSKKTSSRNNDILIVLSVLIIMQN